MEPIVRFNYMLMVITFVYGTFLFCDSFFKTKKINSKLNLLALPTFVVFLSMGYILEIPATGILVYTIFAYSLLYVGLCFVGYVWFCLATSIFFKNDRISLKIRLIAGIFPVLLLLFIAMNPLHHLISIAPHDAKMTYSAEYYCMLIFSGLYILVGNVILGIEFFKSKKLTDRHRLLFFVEMIFLTVLLVSRIAFRMPFEIMPLILLISFHLLVYFVSIPYKLFDVTPGSITSLIQNIDQAVVITDAFNKVISFNPAFLHSFGHVVNLKADDSLQGLINSMKEVMELDEESHKVFNAMISEERKKTTGRIHMKAPQATWYFVLIQQIYNKKGRIIGKLISFNDMTYIDRLNQSLKQKKTKLG
jgi:hypothetical protein